MKNEETTIKENRVYAYMHENGFEAVVLGRFDNFAWLTGGGDNRVLLASETGACALVLTMQGKYVIAASMDSKRIAEEDMSGMDYELIELKWYEKSVAEVAQQLVTDIRTASDIRLPGIEYRPGDFHSLHYPLTPGEINKYRWLGIRAEEIICDVATEIRLGVTEKEIEARIVTVSAAEGIRQVVGIVGSDSRISKYRHCVASDKKVEKMVLLAPALQKWGLNVPLSRMVCLDGHVPAEIADKYEAACIIEAHTLALCEQGARFADILQAQKEQFRILGYPEEWRNHFQGGITGYVVNDPTKCLDPSATISPCQTFNWYITITGVKVEETVLSSSSGVEMLTSTGLWPIKRYSTGGKAFDLPQILIL